MSVEGLGGHTLSLELCDTDLVSLACCSKEKIDCLLFGCMSLTQVD